MTDIWQIMQNNLIGFLMIFARVVGIFSFNPIFNRNNIPSLAKIGTSLALAVIMTASFPTLSYEPSGVLPFAFDILKEAAVGVVLGFYVNLLMTVFMYAGDNIDMQSGLSMGKSYDPSFGNVGIFASYFNYWFIMYFFATGGHLEYIRLFSISYETIPMGFSSFNINFLYIIVSYLTTVITLALRLVMPVIVTELIVEMCLGVMMKAVPSVHVFVLNIQLKVMVGILMMTILAAPIGEFMGYLTGIMWDSLYGLLPTIALPA